MQSQQILKYLGLPSDYEPTPDGRPIAFLSRHLQELPPGLLEQFSSITTPKQRSEIPVIRNRRFKFCDSDPKEFRIHAARRSWPTLWEGSRAPPGREEGEEEQAWADREFMGGERRPYVGKLGKLLGEYEEEREAERTRMLRRTQLVKSDDFIPEEDESSDEEDEGVSPHAETPDPEADEAMFTRRVRERFIYGLLESTLYDTIDWDDIWDVEDRDAEERWFDDDEE